MSDWGPGTNTGTATNEWGNNGFGGGDDFGNNGDDTAQFGGGVGDGFGDGFGITEPSGVDGGSGGKRGCFNCGQEGHNKSECPNPAVMKEFTGTCRVCEKEGHMAKDCPDKPAETCRNCGEEGHRITECKGPRKVNRSDVEIVAAEEAWRRLETGVIETDVDDIKTAVQQYVKACPGTSYLDLEKAFRQQDIGLYLIATKKSLLPTMTNMDFQGNLDKTYTVNYRFDMRPARPREAVSWPKTPEDNLERLKDAGEVVSRGMPQCSNCNEIGHIAKNCPQDKRETERVTIKCFNCDEEGHRVRDCPKPRQDRFACKNCGKSGHKAADCTEPRVAGPDVECRKCGESGHFSRDCPQGGGGGSRGCFNCGEEGHMSKDCTAAKKIICRNCDDEGHRASECPKERNMAKVQCRNCDEYGHESRQCPKERDYSRVTCTNCGETGHTKVRCKKETVAPESLDNGFDTGPVDIPGWNNDDTAAAGDTTGWAGGDTNADAGEWGSGNGNIQW